MGQQQQPEYQHQEEVNPEPEAALADRGQVKPQVPFVYPAMYHDEPDWDEQPNWVPPIDPEAPDYNKDPAAYNKYYNLYQADDMDSDEALDLVYDEECWSWECKHYVPPSDCDAEDAGYTSDYILPDSEDEEEED